MISGIDVDGTMETSAVCNANKSNESSEQVVYQQYNPGHMGMGNMAGPQQGQQPQYQQPPPQYSSQHQMFTDMNAYCGNGAGLLMDSRANGGVVMGTGTAASGMGGNAFAQQFTQPHPNLRQQSSVGSMGHYRM